MAYIDKTYITSYQQAVDYVNWSKENKLVYNGRVMNPIPYYSLEEYKEHFSSNEKEIAFLNTSLSEDYFLIKYCPLDFIQERMKEIYDEDYYNSIKNGTSHFDTFDRNSITGNKVKCIKESNFGNKRFHYKSRKRGKRSPLRYWVEIIHPDYFLDYEENIDKWLISGYELYKPYCISNVCHKHIKSRKALIRNIRKWNLPKDSIIRWRGEYIGDEMEFKILGKNISKKFN